MMLDEVDAQENILTKEENTWAVESPVLTAINGIELSEQEKLWLQQHGVLKVSNQENWPPIDFVQNNIPMGLSIDYLNLLASKIGIKFEYVNGLPWNVLMERARDGQIDILHSLYQTDQRSEYLNFTRPYLDVPVVYFGRVGSDPIVNPEDLSGRRIGAIKGFAQTEVFRTEFPHLEITEFETINDAFLELSSGKVDVVADSLLVAQYIISQNFITGLEVIGTDFFTQGHSRDLLRIASHKNEPLLASILQKAMDSVTSEEFKLISDEWQEKYTVTDSVDLSYDELRWLSENQIIDVAVDPHAFPYEFINEEGELDGVSGDVLDLISRKLDVEFRWVGNKSLEEGVEMVAAGEVFVLPSMVAIEERLKDYKFTDSYINVSNVIFTRVGAEVFGTMESLNGKTIAQVTGYSTTKNIQRDFPDITVVEVGTSAEALKKLAVGEVDAFIGSIPLTSKVITDNSLSNIIVTGETPYTMRIAIAIRADQVMLAGILQKALASINETEKMIINQKWVSFTVERPPDYTLIWRVVGISLLALTIIFVWALSLRREVRRRELLENNLMKMQLDAEAARQEAEMANNAKSNFLANMSHEIRTPLNAIIGFSELISSEVFGALKEPKYKEYIEDIHDSGLHLSTVINDILDLSKIEAGKWALEEETFLLGEVVKSVFKLVEKSAHDKNISLTYESDEISKDLMVCGDVNCIKRVIINLLSNAIKFTEENGAISCQISRNGAGDLEVIVSDNGIGIPKHRLERVLSPFEQVNENSHVKDVGTGLGLSIVKELVELHGGKFRLESIVGQGTDAIVILPKSRITP